MSIKKGNDYLRNSNKKQAIAEYKKLDNKHALYNQAQFNILLIENNLKDFTRISTVNEIIDEPLVSIIMPVFNVAPYLDASILSVLNQTYKNIEVIIVNDASTDNGLNIINMFANQDKRIKVIDLEFNTLGGAGIPSNIGVDAAKGKYIAYADSDDILTNDAIEKMVTLAEKTSSEIVIADFSNFNDETRKVDVSYDKDRWHNIPLEKSFSPKDYPFIFQLSPVPWRKLYKKDYINKYNIYFPEGDYFFEDNPLHWFSLIDTSKISVIDYVVAYHRMGREGQTMSSGAYKLSAMFNHINSIRQKIMKKDNVFIKEFIDFAMKSRWIIERQSNKNLKQIFRKRFYQELTKLNSSQLKIMKPQDQLRLKEFRDAYRPLDLTIVILSENETLLEETLKSLTFTNYLDFNVYVIRQKDEDVIEVTSDSMSYPYDIIYFNIYNGNARIRNSLIPLCSGKYTMFIDAGTLLNDNLTTIINYAKVNSCDFLYDTDMLINSFTVNSNVIIRTNYMRDKNIFFGSSGFSDFSFLWTSFLNTINKNQFDFQMKLKDKKINHDKFLIEEIENILRNIKHKYIRRDDNEFFIDSVSKLLTDYHDCLNLEEWSIEFSKEFSMIDNLKNINVLKEKK